ncbi:MAG: DUF1700 domain-containing protein [Clostridiales bacterium]|nr:DUF1700 domain-containing protein [Clostridiales bacterium]
MNRKEFIEKLRAELGKLPKEEAEAAIYYYEEYLDEAGPGKEQEIIEGWGNPKKIAGQIKSEYAVKMLDTDEGPATKKGLSAIWWVIIGIVSAPVSIPVAFGLLILVIGGAAAAIGIILGIFGAIIGCLVGAGACVVVGIMSIPVALSSAIMFIGIGLAGLAVMAAIGVAVVMGIRALVKALVRAIRRRNERKSVEKRGYVESSDYPSTAGADDNWKYKEGPEDAKKAFETQSSDSKAGEEEKKDE